MLQKVLFLVKTKIFYEVFNKFGLFSTLWTRLLRLVLATSNKDNGTRMSKK